MKKLIIPGLVFLMLASGCFYMTAGPTGGSQMPTITSFNASPPSVSPGESATLTWEVSGATSVTIDQGVGSVALTGSRAVMPAVTTVFTLTATSAGGTASATAQVMVSGTPTPTPMPTPTPTPTPTPSPMGYPVVHYFTVSPPSISSGGTATLSWSVSNANSVTIDQGVGGVGLVGTASVSPAATTMYTLMATNTAGSYIAVTNVFVGAAPPPAGKPDLVITDISRSGNFINYTIKNQGTAPVGTHYQQLRIDGVTKSYDPLVSLAAGASKTESFATYTYACSGTSDTIEVWADAYNAISEESETNNSKSVSWICNMVLSPGVIQGVLALKPDLVITTGSPTVSPLTVAAGGTISLSAWTVKNQGTFDAGSFSNGFYLSTDAVITSGDTYLTGNSNSGLASGAQFNWGGPTLTIPGGTPPGNYYVGILVDRTNSVSESNENNNYVSRLITVH